MSSNFQAELKESDIEIRSEWMKSGHGGRKGQKRPKMGGRPLYTVSNALDVG